MVISANERSAKEPAKQGFAEETRKPIQINGSTLPRERKFSAADGSLRSISDGANGFAPVVPTALLTEHRA